MNHALSKSPSFNLKVVVAETGIKPDTLRAWEKRYGLPTPKRTKGGHRLYSAYDIEVVKWLMQRQEEGLTISRAVKLWRQLEQDGLNPLALHEAVQGNGRNAPETHKLPLAGSRLDKLRQEWLAAIYNFDEAASEQILAQAFALFPPETVCLELLMKGLAAIGQQWYEGEATIQQEHFASALAMRRLHTLLAAAPPPTLPERIIVACPPQEDHTFSPLLLSLMLRYRGWHVIYLGANVPLERMETTLETVHPDLVLLTAQQLHTAASMLEIARFLYNQHVPLAFGGLIFNLLPSLKERIPGHFLGNDLAEVPQVVENLLRFQPAPPAAAPPPASYQTALHSFQERQSQIEAALWSVMKQHGMPYEHFVNANMQLAKNITAALTLGDMRYIGVELAWIEQLLSNYNWPPDALKLYLAHYRAAAEQFMNGDGRPVLAWMQAVIEG
jgi:DNA-binding transcriptional MerR regulator